MCKARRGAECLSALLAGAALLVGGAAGCGGNDPAPTGRALFQVHCASCHGSEGRGDGPLAASLNVAPANLRLLARNNDGRFDESRVLEAIDGRRQVRAHGPREMPVWGAVFAEDLRGEKRAEYVTLLRSRSLTDYLRTIQED